MTNSIDHLRKLYDQYQRKIDTDPRSQGEFTDTYGRFIIPEENVGFVLWSNLDESNANTIIQQQIVYFREQGCMFEWKYFNYDTPADLPARLSAAGLESDDEEAVMVLAVAEAPPKLLQPVTHDIRRVTTAEELAGADRVHQVIWGTEHGVTDRVLPTIEANPDSLSMYIAYVDDMPVSYGRIEFPDDTDNPFASIWGGSTLPEYRNRGLYSALVATRLQEAIARGKQYLTVDANPNTSMPILQKLGFVTICTSTPYTWTPAAGI